MRTERKPNADGTTEEHSKPSGATFCGLDEQRQATRFQREEGTDFAVICREDGEEILVEVHDESLTGLGILVDNAFLDLQLSSSIQLVYAGEYLDAEVRHVTRQPGGKQLIGLQCQRLRPTADDT